MAHLYLQSCCGKVEGIAVDTHVHRICNRLKWTISKNPEDTRKQLEEWVPKDYWVDINDALVGFGQTICDSKKPQCDACSIQNTCPYYEKEIKNKKNIKSKKTKSLSKATPNKRIIHSDTENGEQENNTSNSEFSENYDNKAKRNIPQAKIRKSEKKPADEPLTRFKSANMSKMKENKFFEEIESFDDEDFYKQSRILINKKSSKIKINNRNSTVSNVDINRTINNTSTTSEGRNKSKNLSKKKNKASFISKSKSKNRLSKTFKEIERESDPELLTLIKKRKVKK